MDCAPRKNFTCSIATPALLRAIAGGVLAAACLLGGCAKNTSSQWAQTAPIIKSTTQHTPTVSLGARRE